MNCEEFLNLLDAYLDGEASEQDVRRLEEHAKECPSCAMLLETCRDARLSGGDVQPPPEFSAAWRAGIRKEERMEEKRQKKKQWKNWIAVAAAVVFVAGGTVLTREPLRRAAEGGMEKSAAVDTADTAMELGAFTAGSAMSNFAFEAPKATTARMAAEEPMAVEEDAAAGTGQKIIRTAGFTLKTTAFDETLAGLEALTAEYGGRVESLSRNGDAAAGEMRSASLTLRIPVDRLDDFLSGAESVGRVTALTEEQEDVSENYYDMEARLQTQQAKMERLRAMMTQAETVSELIELENAIAETQYSLDSYTGSLRHYDSRIEESAVRVTVREIAVSESQEATLGQRMTAGLRSSLAAGGRFLLDALVFLMAALPWMAVVGVIVLVIVCVRRKKRKDGK